jgi:hypothetical protein
MSEMYKVVEIQSERLARMVAAYLWEEMWWILTFTRRWLLQWGSKGIFNIKKIQNPNLGRWKANNFVDPVLGSLVYQLPEGVTLAYDFCLGCTIARWKGIDEEIHFGAQL